MRKRLTALLLVLLVASCGKVPTQPKKLVCVDQFVNIPTHGDSTVTASFAQRVCH